LLLYDNCLGKREVNARFWWGNLKVTNCFKGLGIDGKIVLKSVLKTYGGRA